MKERRWILNTTRADNVAIAHVLQSAGVTRCGRVPGFGWVRMKKRTPFDVGAVPCGLCSPSARTAPSGRPRGTHRVGVVFGDANFTKPRGGRMGARMSTLLAAMVLR